MNSLQPSFVQDLLQVMLHQIPWLLASVGGIIVVGINWRRSPAASIWSLIAFALLLASSLVMPVVQTAVLRDENQTMEFRSQLMLAVQIVWALSGIVSYICLLVAVYIGRRPTSPPSIPLR